MLKYKTVLQKIIQHALTLKDVLRTLSLTFLPRHMRYTPVLCTDKEPASKDLQHYVYPCLTNSLLSFIFSLGCCLISLSLSQHIYVSSSLGAILPSAAALASPALPTQGRDG